MSENKNLHSGHRQRMLKKLEECGIDRLEDHEILEILLFYALPRVNTNEISHELIRKFGSLREVLEADASELKVVKGVGESASVFVNFIGQLVEKLGFNCEEPADLSVYENIEKYARQLMDGLTVETCFFLFLDESHHLISRYQSSSYSKSRVKADLRKVIVKADKTMCSNVIVLHNHLSDSAAPSTSDIAVTRHIYDLLSTLQITLTDHIIVARDSVFSMRRAGFIPVTF